MIETTKDKLLTAGAALFLKKGYAKTTVGDIESAAGLTPRAGGFYRHFKSKEALLIEIVRRRVETPEKLGLNAVLPLGDTRAELLYIARAYERLNQSDDGLTHLIRAEAPRIAALQVMITDANETLLQALSDWIESKRALDGKARTEITHAVMMVFGPWLFFLLRREEIKSINIKRPEAFLLNWAAFWGKRLDRKNGLEG